MTNSIWYKTQPAIGTIISGESLKEYAERGWFKPTLCTMGTENWFAPGIDLSGIEDNETWIIGRNANSGTIMFVQIFTNNRVIIETDALPEGSPALKHYI
jgi:hypothetical protein